MEQRQAEEEVMQAVSEEKPTKLKPGELRPAHSFETRLKARSLYLSGASFRKVSRDMKLAINTVIAWAREGQWEADRQRLVRHLARKELKRVADEAALELRNSGKLLNKMQDILETQFYKPEIDPATNTPIPGAWTEKGRGDWKLRDEAVMQFLLMLTQRRESHLKTSLDFLGDYFPKVAPEGLKLPIAGRIEEAAAEAAEAAGEAAGEEKTEGEGEEPDE